VAKKAGCDEAEGAALTEWVATHKAVAYEEDTPDDYCSDSGYASDCS
jgi:hypothetical protein